MRRFGAIAGLVVLFAACGPINNPAPGAEMPATILPAHDVDVSWHGFTVRLEPTVTVWGRQAQVNVKRIVRRALETSEGHLRGAPTRITVEAGGLGVIPEVGIGGSTDPTSGEIRVAMDSRTPVGLRTMLVDWLPLAMAHELHHAKRILNGPGYGSTLGDAIVAEGEAEAFVREIFPNAPAVPWVRTLRKDQAVRVWDQVQRDHNEVDTAPMHDAWFFGGKSLPRWAGYKIGYALVRSYLKTHPTVTASDTAKLSTGEIFVGSEYDPAKTS